MLTSRSEKQHPNAAEVNNSSYVSHALEKYFVSGTHKKLLYSPCISLLIKSVPFPRVLIFCTIEWILVVVRFLRGKARFG